MNKNITMIVALATSLSLSGCAGILVGGAVAGGAAVASTVHDRRTTGTVIDDRTLRNAIAKKIKADKYVDENSHINVSAYNGIVLLTGEAANQSIAQQIVSHARGVANAKRVESDIFIGPSSSLLNRGKDTATTGKIKAALLGLDLPGFDPTLIDVITERGNVYLMGLVTRNEAAAITQKVRQVSGVQTVTQLFEYVIIGQ